MFSLQHLIKKTSGSGVGGGAAADLCKFLSQLNSGLTLSSAEATATEKQQSSEFNFSDDTVSRNSPLTAHGCCSYASKSESAHVVHLSKQFVRSLLQQHTHAHGIQRHISSKSSSSSSSQQTTIKFAMSSLAAEPLQAEIITSNSRDDSSGITAAAVAAAAVVDGAASEGNASCHEAASNNAAGKKPCFSTGLADILQFMELIGNLKHTKRTGWVLRDVNDCESISGHMYRMSMLTFLLDGSEGLNQIRCMELALVHDLAESLVGDITPFCGVSKDEKRAMEFKAMEDICKLIEPRGKRIMELFEEYEHAQSAESKFVKDLDRLDMVMQAFEYEKRDNCLLKHQEFFDSTEGKFNHPFVKKLVNEIYEQRDLLAKAKGATPPPTIIVPTMELTAAASTPTNLANGQGSSS
ncbi:uncharacterized protein LOC6567124 [Drosophila grimshawi]|uniref:5'-deoxynucleotidase HDDC2 n=1 Tax=Drosophila grimshawi TaxID=7222 RepID=B4JP55_DROGR|nr:uncharacterized protein LOC6567124 [Drosophila grimshawi]XP_032595139.1 uncharacterized protein LOC6567124 [Drosophila grimshawi]EDV99480.1 GH13875 [Drosophila grimshawi]